MSSQRGQRIWKLYQWAVILGGVAAAVRIYILFYQQVGRQDLLFSLGILLLYILLDLVRIPYREQVLSLGFPVVLFALLSRGTVGPLIVAAVVTCGSLCSETLHRLRKGSKPFERFDRVAFYAAHHALAALAATTAFDLIRGQQPLPQSPVTEFMDPFSGLSYILAVVVYILVYSFASRILVIPHDWAIQVLWLPEDSERVPRVHPIGSGLLMAPVPIALYVLGVSLTGIGWVFWLILPILFLAFLVIAQSYARVEQEAIYEDRKKKVRKQLPSMTELDEESMDAISAVIEEELATTGQYWVAIYGSRPEGDTLWLFPAAASQSTDASVSWPTKVKPGQGILGRVVESREVQTGVSSQKALASGDVEDEPVLPEGAACLYIPLFYSNELVGLMALARPQRPFNRSERDGLEPLADVLGTELVHIRSAKKLSQERFKQLEQFVDDPTAAREPLKKLMERGIPQVQANEILAAIPEYTLDKRVKETLKARIAGRASSDIVSLDDGDLAAIYKEVRSRAANRMPPLDASILDDLRIVMFSTSFVLGSDHRLSDWPWSDEYDLLYEACLSALEAETIPDIVAQRGKIKAAREKLSATEARTTRDIADQRDEIENASRELNKTENISDEVISALGRLDDAAEELEQAEADGSDRRQKLSEALKKLDAVEEIELEEEEKALGWVFHYWVDAWRTVISEVLAAESAEVAELALELLSDKALPLERVDVALQVKNLGPGEATRVVAELRPNRPKYSVVGDPQCNLGRLQQHQKKVAVFAVEQHERDSLQLAFQVSYWDNQDTRPRTLVDRAELSLEGPSPRPGWIENPYISTLPLEEGSPVFFGREDAFEFVRERVEHREPQTMVITGERQVGKTSFAKRLSDQVKDKSYIHVYFNVKSVGEPRGFLFRLARSIVNSLDREGIQIACPPLEDFLTSPSSVFQDRFLQPFLGDHLGDRKLLIAIDEYEGLAERVEEKEESPRMVQYLQSLTEHSQRIGFVFFGRHGMQEMPSSWHEMFSVVDHTTIGTLSKTEARRLIEKPVKGHIVYDELALQEILRATGRHPFLLQLVCDILFRSCKPDDESSRHVTLTRVRQALQHALDRDWYFQWLWNHTSEEGQALLIGLASCVESGNLGTLEAIVEKARQAGQELGPDTAHRALEQLVQREIVSRSEDGPFYEFTATLYCDWVQHTYL